MERIEPKDTKIPVDKPDKAASSVIECSVNMNLSLTSAKRSRIYRRAQTISIAIIAIIFAIVCFHLKREARALQVQVNCVNSNLMILMLRYEKLNKNFNRIWNRGIGNRYRTARESDLADDIRPRDTRKLANEASPRRESADIERCSDKIGRRDSAENSLEDSSRTLDDRIAHEDAESAERERSERAIVAFERRGGHQPTTVIPGLPNDLIDDTSAWNESRAGRSRRDEGRGKKRRKIKRKLKRSRRRLGPSVATFVGAVPEQHVTDAVYIGPWVKSARNDSRYAFNKFHLVEDRTSIEVTANGLYMISSQIYYFGKPTHYSYWILLSSEGTSQTRRIIKCATVSALTATEASCYTSVVLPLRRGDRIRIQQQERDRLINLREGHSYVQITLLSGESPRRRGS